MGLLKQWTIKDVCVAAVCLWLKQIENVGIVEANTLSFASECSTLQEDLSSDGNTWDQYLTDNLVHIPRFREEDYTEIVKGNNEQLHRAIITLVQGEFYFINVYSADIAHAMGIYHGQNGAYYFFDPNNGLYEAFSIQELMNILQNNACIFISWERIIFIKGLLLEKV